MKKIREDINAHIAVLSGLHGACAISLFLVLITLGIFAPCPVASASESATPDYRSIDVEYEIIGTDKASATADITVDWEDVFEASLYCTTYSNDGESSFGVDGPGAGDRQLIYEGTPPFIDHNRDIDARYLYEAVYSDTSHYGSIFTYWLKKPDGLSASVGNCEVTLSWNEAGEPYAAGYRIEKDHQTVAELDPKTSTSYVDSDVDGLSVYDYWVYAYDGNDPRNESVAATITVDSSGPPEAPTWWRILSGDGMLRLIWNKNPEEGVNRYDIYRSGSQAGPFELIKSVYNKTAYLDCGLTNGKVYYYRLEAYSFTGQKSGFSEIEQGTPQIAADPKDPYRVLVVYNTLDNEDTNKNGIEDTDEILDYYISKRGIPQSNILGVDYGTEVLEWEDFYNVYVAPIKERLILAGPDTIYYIVLVNIPVKAKEGGSTHTLTMNVYNLENSPPPGRRRNPLYYAVPSNTEPKTYSSPKPRFNHAIYDSTGREFYYMVSHLSGITAISQIEASLYGERYGGHDSLMGGYHIMDSQGGSSAVHDLTDPDSPYKLENYPYEPGYRYGEMDQKMVAAVRYFDVEGIRYLWHNQKHVAGAVEDDHFEDGTPVWKNIPALSYGGWHDGARNIYNWLPGSFYTQAISSSCTSADIAFTHGITFVSGALFEPYTNGVVQPFEMVYYALEGYTYGEAVSYGLPLINWANCTRGDPLTCIYHGGPSEIDTTPPPVPDSHCEIIAADEVEIHASLDTIGRVADIAYWKLEYGRIPGQYGEKVDYDPRLGYWNNKKFILKDLEQDADYYYRISVKDPAGNETVTPERTFILPPANRLPYYDRSFIKLYPVQGQTISLHLPPAFDPDGDDITYTTYGLPEDCIFNPVTLAFSWKIPLWVTRKRFYVYANDADGRTAMTVDITIYDLKENKWEGAEDTDGSKDANWSLGHAPASDETVVFDSAASAIDCVLPGGTYRQIVMRNNYSGRVTLGGSVTVNSFLADCGTLDATGAVRITVKATINMGQGLDTASGFTENAGIRFENTVLAYGNIRAKYISFAGGWYRDCQVFIHPDAILDPTLYFTDSMTYALPIHNTITLRSMEYGKQYRLGDETEASVLRGMDIKDARALGAGLTVRASRDSGNNTNITFLEKSPPYFTDKKPGDKIIGCEGGETRAFSVIVNDSEFENIQVRWFVDGDIVKSEETSPGLLSSYQFEVPYDGDTHSVKVVAADPDGEAAGLSWFVEVGAESIMYGDISGDDKVTALDAALAARYAIRLINLSEYQIIKADVDKNGRVTAYDAALIARYAVGIITSF